MDAGAPHLYTASPMTRMLLTLLALLTGLSATGASAEVRMSAACEAAVGLVDASTCEASPFARPAMASLPVARFDVLAATPLSASVNASPAPITVRLGADRARE